MNEHSPNGGFLWKETLAFFPVMPLLLLGWMSCFFAKCSVCPDCLQGVSVAWNPQKKCSPSWRSLICYENPFFSKARESSTLQARVIIVWWQYIKLHKKRGWKLPIYNVCCSQWTTTSPNRGFLREQLLLFSKLGLSISSENEPLHCQKLCMHWLFKRGFIAWFAMKMNYFHNRGKAEHSEL